MSHDPRTEGLRILGAPAVQSMLHGREDDILAAVREAYLAHYQERTSLPHSSFLRFPEHVRNRIIALPAYLGGPFDIAGVKWIASFPGNLDRALPRASAVMVLNDLETGFPIAVLEAGTISAKRTAASAALAAQLLHPDPAPTTAALVGAGRINGEVLGFLRAVFPSLTTVYVHDLIPDHTRRFVSAHERTAGVAFHLLERAEDALAKAPLVSLATTASTPYMVDSGSLGSGATLLHISLRDLHPDTILRAVNIADDVDHVCRERTSLHLTELQTGHRQFIQGTLEPALRHGPPQRTPDDPRPLIFSPFGLGILDLAVAAVVLRHAEADNTGLAIADFFFAPEA